MAQIQAGVNLLTLVYMMPPLDAQGCQKQRQNWLELQTSTVEQSRLSVHQIGSHKTGFD